MGAAIEAKLEALKLLIQAKSDINATDKNGQSPLIQACADASKNYMDKVIFELIKSGAAVKTKDAKGDTALMYAVSEGAIEVVKALIEAGADVNVKDIDGITAMNLAEKYEYPEIAKLLKAAGAK